MYIFPTIFSTATLNRANAWFIAKPTVRHMPFNKINQDLDPANASQDVYNRSSGLIVTGDVGFDKRNKNQILNDVEMEQDDLKQEAKDDSKVSLFVF